MPPRRETRDADPQRAETEWRRIEKENSELRTLILLLSVALASLAAAVLYERKFGEATNAPVVFYRYHGDLTNTATHVAAPILIKDTNDAAEYKSNLVRYFLDLATPTKLNVASDCACREVREDSDDLGFDVVSIRAAQHKRKTSGGVTASKKTFCLIRYTDSAAVDLFSFLTDHGKCSIEVTTFRTGEVESYVNEWFERRWLYQQAPEDTAKLKQGGSAAFALDASDKSAVCSRLDDAVNTIAVAVAERRHAR